MSEREQAEVMNLHVTFLKWGEGLKVFMCYQSMRLR